MIKVKEFLDANFIQIGECTAEIKSNGHYNVQGTWCYKWIEIINPHYIPKSQENENLYLMPEKMVEFGITVSINNETMYGMHIVANGEYFGEYGYLQTYEHIPRGEPDDNGYYRRSTDVEIIRYLQKYMALIDSRIKL